MTSETSTAAPPPGTSVLITDPVQMRLHNSIAEALLAYIADCIAEDRTFEPAAIVACKIMATHIALTISTMAAPSGRHG